MAVLALGTKTGIEAVDRALDELRREVDRIQFPGGVRFELSLVAGLPLRIAHGLGRPFKGWIVTRASAGSYPFEVNRSTTNRSKEIWLQCASNNELEIYLF